MQSRVLLSPQADAGAVVGTQRNHAGITVEVLCVQDMGAALCTFQNVCLHQPVS